MTKQAKLINQILIILEVFMIVVLIITLGYKYIFTIKEDNKNINFEENITKDSQYFYKIKEIVYFDNHIFCSNYSRNSVTILDKDGNCQKELKFAENDGHSSVDMFLLENKLYIYDVVKNIKLEYNKWDLYKKEVTTDNETEKFLNTHLNYIHQNDDEYKKRVAYIDKNNYYEINKQGTKLYKVEGENRRLIKENDKILDVTFSVNVEFIVIAITMILHAIRYVFIVETKNKLKSIKI